MSTEMAEALAARLMAGKEPGSPEWDEAMAVLLAAMQERKEEQRPRNSEPVQRSITV